jgi:DNA-binding NarL/FixJ family response regulator/class 3 adenylate cyclase
MPELPDGLVTLLFTDVEGSTALVQRLGGSYGAALEQHRRLVREAVEGAGGILIDTRGDECSSVFLNSGDAVRAAVAAQRMLSEHDWEQGAEFRVRIGIHTGEPQIANGSYYGLDVHRVARISAAGHGGQVLVSRATCESVSGEGFELRELGTYTLRGLDEPEYIYQVVAPGLDLEFPILRLDVGLAEENGAAVLNVVVAEDSVLLREGIARLLEDAGFDVVGQAGDADELMLKVRSYKPNIAIVDIRMPPTHTDEGLRAAREIREKHPETGVLVLSQYLEPAYALELLSESAEGVGYLLKDRVADVDGFVEAVRRVAGGGSALDPAVVSQLVGRQRRNDPLGELTPREREVIELMASGRSNAAIAGELVVTERAVEKHVTSIFSKLRLPASQDAHRRVLAVLAYLRSE